MTPRKPSTTRGTPALQGSNKASSNKASAKKAATPKKAAATKAPKKKADKPTAKKLSADRSVDTARMLMLSDDGLKDALARSPHERVTDEYIRSRIRSVDFYMLPETTITICSIELDNGFSVRGESACVDPRNFDKAIGERISYDNAYRQLWPLFGFLLAEIRNHRKGQG